MFVGVDVGATHIKVASFASLESPKVQERRDFPAENNYQRDLANLTQAIKEAGRGEVDAIGLGLPGVLNVEKNRLDRAPNLPAWEGREIVQDLEKEFVCLVKAENDALVAALGEALYGYGRTKDFLFIVWGTGVGGATVHHIGEQVELSSFEPGHQILDWGGPKDTCGQNGCLQAFCGGRALEKRFGKPAKELDGDEWVEVSNYFAQGLINVIAIRPTKLIIFGGGVAVNYPISVEQVKLRVQDQLSIYPMPEIIITEFGQQVGVYGALGLLS